MIWTKNSLTKKPGAYHDWFPRLSVYISDVPVTSPPAVGVRNLARSSYFAPPVSLGLDHNMLTLPMSNALGTMLKFKDFFIPSCGLLSLLSHRSSSESQSLRKHDWHIWTHLDTAYSPNSHNGLTQAVLCEDLPDKWNGMCTRLMPFSCNNTSVTRLNIEYIRPRACCALCQIFRRRC